MDDYDKGLIKMAEKKNPTLKKAREEITYLTGDAAVQRLEELREKWEMDRISAIDFAEERGKKAGIEEEKEEEQKEIAKKNAWKQYIYRYYCRNNRFNKGRNRKIIIKNNYIAKRKNKKIPKNPCIFGKNWV